MSFPSYSGKNCVLHAQEISVPTCNTRNESPIYDSYGFRINPLKEEDLEEGELLCDVCKGYGYTYDTTWGRMVCKKCQGIAKLDWVERIVGKKQPEFTTWSGYTAVSGWPWVGGSGYFTSSDFTSSGYVGSSFYVGASNYPIDYSVAPISIEKSEGESLCEEFSSPSGSSSDNFNSMKFRIFDFGSWKNIPTIVAKNKNINKLINGFKTLMNGD